MKFERNSAEKTLRQLVIAHRSFPRNIYLFRAYQNLSVFNALSRASANQTYDAEMRGTSLMAVWCSGKRARDLCLFQNVIREIFVKKRAQRSSEKVNASGKARVKRCRFYR